MNEPRPFFDDPRLTAYALGELAADERPAVEAALRANPALRAAIEEIRTTAAIMEAALAGDPAGATSPAAAPVTLAGLTGQNIPNLDAQTAPAPAATRYDRDQRPPARPRRKLIVFPQFYFIVSGLAVAGFAVMVALYRDTFDAKERIRAENLRLAMESRAIQAREAGRETTIVLHLPEASEPLAVAEADLATPKAGSSLSRLTSLAAPRENAFLGAAQNPLSTIPADADTTSYARIRHAIAGRKLPPASTVRIEELLNYFSYRYPAPPATTGPGSGASFAASLEVAEAPWAPSHRLVRIGIKGREVAAADRPAASLVMLIDVSSSMNAPNRLPLVKNALRTLISALRPDDRIALVTYAGNSGLALPSTPVAKSREILAALDALAPGGPTDSVLGFQLAYDIAKANAVSNGVNRVILCTDGDLNVGTTGAGELARLVEERAKAGVFLSVLGFGMDHQRDSNLQALAHKGNGQYGAIDSRGEAEKLIATEVTNSLASIARDVKVQVEFNPAKVASYRLIGYEDQSVPGEDSAHSTTEARETGSGHAITALYEVVPVGAEGEPGSPSPQGGASEALRYQTSRIAAKVPATVAGELLTVKLRYRDPAGSVSRSLEFPLVDRGGRFAAASADFRFAAAVAEFGMILRGTPHRGSATLRDVLAWATTANPNSEEDPGGQRAEFLDLVRRAQSLME